MTDVLISIMSGYSSFVAQLSLLWLWIVIEVLGLGFAAVWIHVRYGTGKRS